MEVRKLCRDAIRELAVASVDSVYGQVDDLPSPPAYARTTVIVHPRVPDGHNSWAARLAAVIARTRLDPWDAHVAAVADAAIYAIVTLDAVRP
jgi:hypothetical protein